MSGSPQAMADLLPAMFHGGKIALLGIMPDSAAIDWNVVVFKEAIELMKSGNSGKIVRDWSKDKTGAPALF